MAYTDVKLHGYVFPATEITWKLAAGTVAADVGKPMTISANNTMKVAGADEMIHGRLMSFEDRSDQGLGLMGTISHQYTAVWAAAASHGLVAGDQVIGAAAGTVKKAAADIYTGSVVAEVIGNNITVIKI